MARPARDYAEASDRFARLASLDDGRIIPDARSRFFTTGARAPLAVVLLHGFTNVPEQWATFAEDLRARGHNVVVPRFPGHGDVSRSGRSLRGVRAVDFLRTASAATDVACGAGDRVVVAGLSIGGAMAAWLGQRRPDVARSVPIVPLFGIARCDAAANAALTALLGMLPDRVIPWDPRARPEESPPYAYPDFPTRTLAECVRIGLAVYRTASQRPPSGSTAMLLNANEPACNNALACAVAARFSQARAGACDVTTIEGLPANHDVIDPTNPHARIDIVYPRVRSLIEGDS